MSQREFERGPDAYRRRGPSLKPRRTYLIVTEGKKTEPSYFEALKRRLHLSNVEVHVRHPEATDPKSLTDEAIRLDQRRRREAKQDYGVRYDEVWVVYDLEKPNGDRRRLHKEQQSRQKAQGISVAVSDPSFEFWYLLHFESTTGSLADGKSGIKRLKRHWPEYEKASVISEAILARTADAIVHADRCRRYHKASGGSGNPGTDVDILVQSLNAVAAEAFRFPLPARR